MAVGQRSFFAWFPTLFFLCCAIPSAEAFDKTATCQKLSTIKLANTEIKIAQLISEGIFKAPDNVEYSVPAFCRVEGIIRPVAGSEITFELWLPTLSWNGRYHQFAMGGQAGSISYKALETRLNQGDAVATTDTGHQADGLDWSWALKEPQKIIDWGYRAHQLTAIRSKRIVHRFYGKTANYSYLSGCSNGGRAALVMAQRYPNVFDGILAGDPANFYTRYWANRLWVDLADTKNEGGRIPNEKLPMIRRAALASCLPSAHVVDGIPADPRFCAFDPASLLCRSEDGDDCLTQPQVETLNKIYRGPVNPRTGHSIHPGFMPTAETDPGWIAWNINKTVTADPGRHYRNFVFDNPNWDPRTFDFDSDLILAESKDIGGQRLGDIVNAEKTDLRQLEKRGAKILMYFGWYDGAISPKAAVDYYRAVADEMGGMESLRGFFRLFMVPGMAHCAGGAGVTSFGQLSGMMPAAKDDSYHNIVKALEAWVENGNAPNEIIAAKFEKDDPENQILMTRPICAFPEVPIYKGEGSTDDASNFDCALGRQPSLTTQ